MTKVHTSDGANGAFVFKRTLRLRGGAGLEGTLEALAQLPGVITLRRPRADRLQLHYDARRLQIDGVLALLEGQAVSLDDGLWQRWRLGWYRYVDANAAANAQRTDTHCCNKPPPGH